MYVSKYLYQVEKKHVYIKEPDFHCVMIMVMVFNANFNNMPQLYWWRKPEKSIDLPQDFHLIKLS
jgi:hypothetical protein